MSKELDYLTILTRAQTALAFAQLQMAVAHDLFGVGYLSLTQGQAVAVDAAVMTLWRNNFSALAPDQLRELARTPVGFQPATAPAPPATPESPPTLTPTPAVATPTRAPVPPSATDS